MSGGLGGFRPWFFQRISAVYLLAYLIFFLAQLLICPIEDYARWKAWLSAPVIWMATGLFFLALFIHLWVGLRDVILDYIHPVALRVALLTGLGAVLAALTLWVFRALVAVV